MTSSGFDPVDPSNPSDPNASGETPYGQPAGYPAPSPYQQSGGYPPPAPYGSPYGQPVFGAKPGGLGARFFARIVDGFLVNIVAFVLSLFAFGDHYPWLVTGIFSGALMFGYFVLFEVTQGATPGKKMFGLAVHGPGGAPRLTAKQSALRNAFTLLPIVPYLGGLLMFVAVVVIAATISGSPTKQGKHDDLAGGTQVVKP